MQLTFEIADGQTRTIFLFDKSLEMLQKIAKDGFVNS